MLVVNLLHLNTVINNICACSHNIPKLLKIKFDIEHNYIYYSIYLFLHKFINMFSSIDAIPNLFMLFINYWIVQFLLKKFSEFKVCWLISYEFCDTLVQINEKIICLAHFRFCLVFKWTFFFPFKMNEKKKKIIIKKL